MILVYNLDRFRDMRIHRDPTCIHLREGFGTLEDEQYEDLLQRFPSGKVVPETLHWQHTLVWATERLVRVNGTCCDSTLYYLVFSFKKVLIELFSFIK